MTPLIGITAYVEDATWGSWHAAAALVPHAYVRAVESAGARALIVPPNTHGTDETIAVLDGIIFAGGPDIDPIRYGEEARPETTGIRPARDAGEFELLRAALADDLPVLGICRGMQLMNIGLGGTLDQHLPDVVGHNRHREAIGVYGWHDVDITADSGVGRVLGRAASVPSYHHQGIAEVGKGLQVAARAPDGTVEAIEVEDRRFAMGVLWHPEMGDDPRLFEALVRAAGGLPATTRE